MTGREALRRAAAKAGEALLIIALLAASLAVWGFLFVASGLRAWWYGAGDLLVYGGAAIGTAIVVGSAMAAHGMIRRNRAAKAGRRAGASSKQG